MENDSTMDADCDTTFVGRVYRIWSPQTNLVYIGSTRKTLGQRFLQHKKNFRKWQRGNFGYTSSYDILQYDDAQIELVTEDEFGDALQLREMEKYWINNSNSVNKRSPLQTREERCEYDRVRGQTEKGREQHRRATHNWQIKNKERLLEYQRVYGAEKIPCPTCGKVMRRDSLRTHKRKHATSI
jgi:hypothetical protein